MARVPASRKTRKRIAAMMNGKMAQVDRSMVIREAACLIVEEVLEGEVTDALGSESCAQGAAARAQASRIC